MPLLKVVRNVEYAVAISVAVAYTIVLNSPMVGNEPNSNRGCVVFALDLVHRRLIKNVVSKRRLSNGLWLLRQVSRHPLRHLPLMHTFAPCLFCLCGVAELCCCEMTVQKPRVSYRSIPNLLTLFRIAAVPLFVGTFFLKHGWSELVGFIIFVVASITDFFDGYLARLWNQQSAFGRFLDPLADKLLVAAALLMLVYAGRIGPSEIVAAVIILCREVLVSGLREFLAELQVIIHVSTLAKYKTTMQMVALSLLILGQYAPFGYYGVRGGKVLLWIAGVLTLVTGIDYFIAGMKHIRAHDTGATLQAAPSAVKRARSRSRSNK